MQSLLLPISALFISEFDRLRNPQENHTINNIMTFCASASIILLMCRGYIYQQRQTGLNPEAQEGVPAIRPTIIGGAADGENVNVVSGAPVHANRSPEPWRVAQGVPIPANSFMVVSGTPVSLTLSPTPVTRGVISL